MTASGDRQATTSIFSNRKVTLTYGEQENAMPLQYIKVEVSDYIATVVMDRPQHGFMQE